MSVSQTRVLAQMRVGMPSQSPDSSAAFEVSSGPYKTGSTFRGLIPPKVALVRTTLTFPITASPALGLLVFNTSRQNDVTPGYYYWEGSKWLRFSTGASASARIDAGGGQSIPAYLLSEVRALTSNPDNLFLVEPGREGLFRYDATDNTSPDNGGTILVTSGGSRYKRPQTGIANVAWWGAVGNGVNDDTQAIQNAVNYAKSLSAGGGGTYRVKVLLPEGNYRITQAIDVTNANGVIISGSGGRYINTGIIGCTPNVILDFTGSTMSGCENLTIQSINGYTNVSTIGVLFALNNAGSGGLNCTLSNCYIQMADQPAANNGMGTIGLLNCRSEEFTVTTCLIKANVGCVFSNKNTLADVGYNFTITSPFTPVATSPNGSMGVVNFNGQNSIQNRGRAQPALVLNGTNSISFHGYLSRSELTGNGSNEAAIICGRQQTYNLTINGTVESFAQLLHINGAFENCTINAVVANQTSANSANQSPSTTPVIDVSEGQINGCKINIAFGNPSEQGNRYLLYHVLVGGGNQPATGSIRDSDITCSTFADNALVISANLLKNTDNTIFHTGQPFEKQAGIIRQLFANPGSAGTLGNVSGVTVMRFKPADQTNLASLNAGYYQIYVRGIVTVGNYGSGGIATRSFNATITLSQAQNSGKGPAMSSVVLQPVSTIDPNFQNITNVSVSLDISDPYHYKIIVTPTLSGSGTNEPVTVDASVEIKSGFRINEVVIFS